MEKLSQYVRATQESVLPGELVVVRALRVNSLTGRTHLTSSRGRPPFPRLVQCKPPTNYGDAELRPSGTHSTVKTAKADRPMTDLVALIHWAS